MSALVNAAIIGFSFLFTKIALEDAGPVDTLAFRFAVSFAAMSIPAALGLIKLQFRGKPLFRVILLAAFYPLGFFLFQTFGLQHANSAEGGIMYAFTPVLTMVLAYVFLKETTSLGQKLGILLSVFGVVFIFVMGNGRIDFENMTGLLLLFLSGLAFAGYSVLARSLLKLFSPWEISYLTLGIGCLVFLAVSVAGHASAGTLGNWLAPLRSGRFILSVIYLGVLSSLVTALSSNYALSKLEASRVSVFSNLSTVVSIAAGAMVLGEKVTVYHVIGSLLIIAGVTGANLLGAKSKGETSKGENNKSENNKSGKATVRSGGEAI
ncbi:DMT family transporter [Paenibacillus macerans]|uniref:EamA-like transporter family protein n=1 Tax=Paenibacillus macerans TaxID=44252 RepID=A0A090ZL78_PAEMA|nr:DMT family transporter [Paenibacillus macerans]KFN11020.1 eamA-like transporter family protein [Paenibacillus macerans]MCY7560861.1 DMT family transporter [Paenibacillus macerans]MEC0152219.1 DMT family transporter [Paenibacillus macerans]SUA83480.1 transporter [Paenibacillus macerans]